METSVDARLQPGSALIVPNDNPRCKLEHTLLREVLKWFAGFNAVIGLPACNWASYDVSSELKALTARDNSPGLPLQLH